MPSQTPDVQEHPLNLLWALPEHASTLAALHARLFDNGWDEASMARSLAHPGSLALIATTMEAPHVIGFILAQAAADEAEILSVGVIPEWQRQGVGARLVEALRRAAHRAGASRMFLDVAVSNAAARQLYSRAGFIEIGRRQSYYTLGNGTREDALLLALVVTPGSSPALPAQSDAP